jgi:CDP-glucose 4,6-dehydratase
MENLVNMHKLLQNCYNGKRVFITGHTGFKGAWLLKILNLFGAEVKGYSLDTKTDVDLYNLINGNLLCDSVIADIRSKNELEIEILNFKPDFIFHLAAQPLVRFSYENPLETFDTNIIGTANLLDAVRFLEGKCQVVLITTDKVYHNNEWIYPYREVDRLGGYDPYSASKACAELLIDSYKNSFFNSADYPQHLKTISVARAGNVIGGGDWSKDRLLPDIVTALSSEKVVVIRNPNSIRPWQHVVEPLLGYLLLGLKAAEAPLVYSQAYNFGPNVGDALSVKEMVRIAIDFWGKGSYEVHKDNNQLHEAGLLKLDITKALNELMWRPKLNAQKAVEKTIIWYKTFYYERENIISITENQILDILGHE